jgi:type I restriction enzyme, S subunit
LSTLPKGWKGATLGDVLIRVIGGGTPSRNVPSFFNGDIPWFTVKDMKSLRPKDAQEHISAHAVSASATNLIDANTVIVATRIALGKAIRPTVPCAINQDLKALHFGTGVNPDFMLYWVCASERKIQDLGSGTTVSGIRLETLHGLELNVPPASEQTRIVAKLEELLSELDAGVAKLKTAQKKLTQYRQSLLKAAVEGALTAEWRKSNPPTETGAQLLERILIERRARWEAKQLAKFKEQGKAPPKDWKSKYPVPVKPDVTGLPELPEGWVWASLDECAFDSTAITDGPFGSNLKTSHYTEVGPRVIRLQNIGDGEFVNVKAHVSKSHFDTLQKHAIEENDLLIAMLGEVLPRACITPSGVAPAIVKADCARVRLNTRLIQPALVVGQLNSKTIRTYVEKFVKGIGRPRVNLGHTRMIPIAICSFAEQSQLESVLSGCWGSIEGQHAAIQQGLARIDAQRKNILKSAFSGKLVPQDSNDEPASTLLAKISANRSESVANTPRRKVTKATSPVL